MAEASDILGHLRPSTLRIRALRLIRGELVHDVPSRSTESAATSRCDTAIRSSSTRRLARIVSPIAGPRRYLVQDRIGGLLSDAASRSVALRAFPPWRAAMAVPSEALESLFLLHLGGRKGERRWFESRNRGFMRPRSLDRNIALRQGVGSLRPVETGGRGEDHFPARDAAASLQCGRWLRGPAARSPNPEKARHC